jgi:hypothetical protein
MPVSRLIAFVVKEVKEALLAIIFVQDHRSMTSHKRP